MGRAGFNRTLAYKLLGLAAGVAIAVAVLSLWFGVGPLASLWSQWSGKALPTDLSDAFLVYQHEGATTVYARTGDAYEPVSLGTTLPTTYLARRGAHLASVQLGERGRYEVRADATLMHASTDLVTGAAVSPAGTAVAFAASDRAAIEAAHAAQLAQYGSQVFLVLSAGEAPVALGDGFAPFFLSDTEVAWFSAAGLMRRDLTTGSTTALAADIRPLPPPYPTPAVSRDGRTIAWVTPDTGTVHIGVIGDAGVSRVVSHEGAKAPTIALGPSALYVLEHTQADTTVWRYALTGGEPQQVAGIPLLGRIIQLVP